MGKNVEQIVPRMFLYRYGRKVKNENLKCKNLGIFSHFEIQTSICFKNFKTLNSSFSLYGYYLQLKTIAKIIRDNPSAPKTLVKLLDEEIELVKSINEIMRDEKMAGKTLISNESVIQRKAAGVLNKLFGQEKTKHLESN
ncbi:hypothetical protein [Campylobacter showae]|jgi:hypothetical protein|uniref:hypothetical protein n=1 Tax=Campylobacter showae TaxID=204 RepID=UPI0026EEDC08|nr:hypothetical protein [Campylobacter showae]